MAKSKDTSVIVKTLCVFVLSIDWFAWLIAVFNFSPPRTIAVDVYQWQVAPPSAWYRLFFLDWLIDCLNFDVVFCDISSSAFFLAISFSRPAISSLAFTAPWWFGGATLMGWMSGVLCNVWRMWCTENWKLLEYWWIIIRVNICTMDVHQLVDYFRSRVF